MWWGTAISGTCILVRAAWMFSRALIPATNKPDHPEGKANRSHVSMLAWTGMRGGVSLIAALAIPLETVSGPFPHRALLIFLTFCVILATLVLQGASLPFVIRWLRLEDDGANEREEGRALATTAKAALRRIDELSRAEKLPKSMADALRARFSIRFREFAGGGSEKAADLTALYRKVEAELLDIQRDSLIGLRDKGAIDNTVMRRIQRLLDLESESIELLGSTSHTDNEE